MTHNATITARVAALLLLSSTAMVAQAQQDSNFAVTVNPGANPPNATTVFPGEITSVRISLQNNGNTAISNASYNTGNSIVLPDNGSASLVVAGPGLTTCGGGSVTATTDTGEIAFSGLSVPANDECYVDVPLRARSADGSGTSLSYVIAAGEVGADGGANSSGGNQAYTIRAVSRPAVSKTLAGAGSTLILGDNARTLRITVTNSDTNIDLSGIAFTDTFPTAGGSALIEPTGTPASGSCLVGGAAATLTSGAAAGVAVSGVAVAAGSSCTIDIPVSGRQTNGSYEASATNRILANSFSSDQGLTPANDATANVRVRSPLAVQKAFTPTVLASGEQGQFTITLSNAATAPLTVDTFTDDPIGAPASGLTIAGVGDISNSCGGGKALSGGGSGFTVSGFDIPAGNSCAITVDYTGVVDSAETPVSYTNSIPEGAVQISSPTGIVSQAESATVIVADRLRVLKSRSPSNAAPGEAVNYSVTIQNFSSSPLASVSLQDTLQNASTLLMGGSFEPSVTPLGACGPLATNGAATGDAGIDFTIATVPKRSAPGSAGECTISFWAMIDPEATTSTSNRIEAGGVCFMEGGSQICNGGASNQVSIGFRSPVTFIKTIDGASSTSKLEGVPARLRLELRNFAAEPLNSVVFSDTLPDDGPFQQLQVAAPANLSNSCGGTVTAVPGTSSVSLNAGTVPAVTGGGSPGACAVEVDVVGPAGAYANTSEATGVRPNADGSSTNIGTQQDSASISYTPALQSSKLFTPESTSDDGLSTLELRFRNVDASQPITGIQTTDNLPAGMTVASPANAYSTCAGTPDISAVAGASSISIKGATLAPGSSCALLVDVVASGTSDWVNEIPPGGITADNGIVNSTAVTATLRYEPAGEPLISKSITPGTIAPGQTATLTVLVTNDSAQDLTNLGLVDWFTVDGTAGATPNGMSLAPAPKATTTCVGGVVTGAGGGTSLRLSGASLPAGQDCSFSAQVSSKIVDTIVNRIPRDAISTDQAATNSTTFAESSLSTTSDFGISKQFTPRVVGADERSRLRIEFLNGADTAVTNFALTDNYPAGLVNATSPNPITNCGAATVTLPNSGSIAIAGGSLGAAVGDSATSCFLEVDVVAATEDTYSNTIPANSVIVDNKRVTHPPATSELQVRQRIIVNKAFDGLTLDAGDPNGFSTGVASRLPGAVAPLTIRLQNPNTIELTEVTFTDTLPDDLVLAVPPNLSTDCTDGVVTGNANGRDITLAGASLAQAGSPGDSCTVTADVYSNLAGTYTNEIPEGDVTSFEGIDNAPGTQAQLVVSEPPVVRKEFLPPVTAPGVPATLRITLENDNDSPATLQADLVDTLPSSPGAMQLADPLDLVLDPACPALSVSAAANDTSVVIDSGSVLPPGGCIITVEVTATKSGDYLNVIPVGALQTSLGPNDRRTEASLQVSTLGYISGKVFLDNQATPDGAFIPGDSEPLPGVTLELRDGVDCAGPLLDTMVTDASGNYLFAGLSAGSYSVCQPAQPPETLNSVTTRGSIVPYAGSTGSPGVAGNPSPTSSQVTGITLGDNGNADEVSGSPDNNFSEILPASVAGNVFFDANNDGMFNAGESGIGGVTIELSGPVSLTTVTAADGSWRFTGLPPGDYAVTEQQPGGWVDGLDQIGTVTGAPVGDDSLSDVFSMISLGPGSAGESYNFGEIAPAGTLQLSANAVCINNAIYVDYSLVGFSGPSSPAVTIRWITTDGRVAEERTGQPGTGRALWPGTSLDASGNATGWPGWAFVDGAWVQIPDDRVPEMTFEVQFNATGSVTTVSYPPSTPSCAAQPEGTFRQESIPATPIWWFLLAALGLVALGNSRLAAPR